MKKLSTITTYSETINLARTYCVFKGLTIKDFVAGLIERELSSFAKWIENNKEIK